MASDPQYATIREILGNTIGQRLVDITQHDEEDFDPETGDGTFVMLMFENGDTLRFSIADSGLEYSGPGAENIDAEEEGEYEE